MGWGLQSRGFFFFFFLSELSALGLQEIDACIVQAKERSYETMLSFGKRSLNIAASAAVQAATKVLWAPVLAASPPLLVSLSQMSSESCGPAIS